MRGSLRVYFGVAPGAGATFAMLDEGTRRASRGTDVVVGAVDTHGRRETVRALGDLEVIELTPAGDLDVDAVVVRRPEVVLVDDLHRPNSTFAARPERWQDVEMLLDAGIDVVTTLEVRHLESLHDVVASVTGAPVSDVVPDAFVRSADQVQLVDQTPEALRRRLAHGNIYPAESIDAATGELFRPDVLAALREMALLWVVERIEARVRRDREALGTAPWGTRERIVVGLTGAPTGDALLRRAARLASRSRGELIGVHVRSDAETSDARGLERQQRLLASLGGVFRESAGRDVADALVRTATSMGATQLVLGASARGRWTQLLRGSVINEATARAAGLDVLIVSPSAEPGEVGHGESPPRSQVHRAPSRIGPLSLSRRRVVGSWIVAVLAPVAVTWGLATAGATLDRSTHLLAFTFLVAIVALVGGFLPAAVAAVSGFLLANWFLTTPTHSWGVAEPEDFVSLVVFVAVAAIIGFYVSVAGRRSIESTRARSHAETLAAMAGAMGSHSPLDTLLEQVRVAFDARSVTVERDAETGERELVAEVLREEGMQHDPSNPIVAALGNGAVLSVDTDEPHGVDSDVLAAFCANLGVALERDRLGAEAVRAAQLAEVERLRTGLLGAVSHDLRTPLAAIKASSSALRRHPEWETAIREELVAGIDQHVDRLTSLVENLLTMSRIQAGAVALRLEPTDLSDAVAAGLALINRRGRHIEIRLDDTPLVIADPHLLERVVGNLLDNACKWSPSDGEVMVDAARTGDRVALRVVDRGPGIARTRRAVAFAPLQRVGDGGAGGTDGLEGTGLGLAIANGFTQAMGGELRIEETPGGGATLVLTLGVA